LRIIGHNFNKAGGSKLLVIWPRSTTAPMKGIRSYYTIAVCKAHSEMQSMSLLGMPRGMPPQKNFEKLDIPICNFSIFLHN